MSTPTPSHRSTARSTFIPRVDPDISLRDKQFLPIYKNLPSITARDPYGLLPWRRRIQITKSCVLEWDNINKGLKIWMWPVANGQRIPPSEFREYRLTHDFRNPSCLCSVHELDPNHVTEAAVFMVRSGSLSGEYVAACARILIERMYPKRGQPIRAYPLREPSAAAPADVLYEGDDDTSSAASTPSAASSSRPLRRAREDSFSGTPVRPFKRVHGSGSSSTAVGNSSPVNPFIVPYATPEPLPTLTSPFSMLLQLDASSNAGLTEAQFRSLFVRCSVCKLFTTTSAFDDHSCRPSSNASDEIIDLTGDE